MYLDFYKLQKAPFHITPDPEFLFLSPSHKSALGCIIHGIEERQGFVAISGEVGLGKTTILRSYLERVDAKLLKAIYIFNANVSFQSLLKTIFGEFGSDPEADDTFEMVNRLHQLLIEAYQQGLNVALIIDEAQNMPIETLENLRMLSNLETNKEKLLQIIMIGQPEFDHKLNLNELRQLKQRIVIRSTIEPLTPEESLAYIQHRLVKASLGHTPVFSKGALKHIANGAKGTPRILNILCTNALIAGFGHRQKPVSVKTVKQVIADFQGATRAPRQRPKLAVALGVMACAGLLWALPQRAQWVSKVIPAQYFNRTPGEAQNGANVPPPSAIQPTVSQPLVQVKYDQNQVNEQTLPSHTVSLSQSQPSATEAPLLMHDKIIMPSQSALFGQNQTSLVQEALPQKQPISKARQIPQEQPQTVFPVIKTARKGDFVSILAIEVYGFSNSAVIKIVKQHNPQIKNLNRISIGDKILFPDLSPYNISTE
jgi:general secretion pathway protein A